MKFLIDANLSAKVSERLEEAGRDSLHVAGLGLLNASDPEIFAAAKDQGRTIITADSDFGTLLALTSQTRPSVIHLRSADHLRPHEQAGLLLANLPKIEDRLEAGAIATFARGRLRVKTLPITPLT